MVPQFTDHDLEQKLTDDKTVAGILDDFRHDSFSPPSPAVAVAEPDGGGLATEPPAPVAAPQESAGGVVNSCAPSLPLCQFGPGGDYTRNYDPKPKRSWWKMLKGWLIWM